VSRRDQHRSRPLIRGSGSQDAALGCVVSGIRPSSRTPPSVSSTARVGGPLFCGAGKWSTWAHEQPTTGLSPFDGYEWLRGHVPIARGRSYTPVAADAGKELSCRETVTYSAPLLVTATATSKAVRVGG
jgi:hypothetical protein